MDISLRTVQAEDFDFARSLYFETMRWIIERLFGWDQAREETSFAGFFKLDEVRIIVADGCDVGWIQERSDEASIYLGSLYVMPSMQGCGIGTHVPQALLARAENESKAVTLTVVKINPAFRFYEPHGFRNTHEDDYKFCMRANPTRTGNDSG